jgi:hypothetical protein
VQPVHRLAKAVAVDQSPRLPAVRREQGRRRHKIYLLTFDLAFELQARVQAVEAGGPLPAGFDETAMSRPQCIALLKRLLRQWAVPPARQFNRVPSRAHVLMCPGLPAAWQNILNAQSGERTLPSGLPPMTHCQVINHTPAGYALRQTDAAPAALRIGELVAIRVEGRTGLQVAMVRWFRNTLKGSGLEFGCELLSERPEAAVARTESAGDARKTPVLVLPEDQATPMPEGALPQLIVPSGAFGVEEALAIDVTREQVACWPSSSSRDQVRAVRPPWSTDCGQRCRNRPPIRIPRAGNGAPSRWSVRLSCSSSSGSSCWRRCGRADRGSRSKRCRLRWSGRASRAGRAERGKSRRCCCCLTSPKPSCVR